MLLVARQKTARESLTERDGSRATGRPRQSVRHSPEARPVAPEQVLRGVSGGVRRAQEKEVNDWPADLVVEYPPTFVGCLPSLWSDTTG